MTPRKKKRISRINKRVSKGSMTRSLVLNTYFGKFYFKIKNKDGHIKSELIIENFITI